MNHHGQCTGPKKKGREPLRWAPCEENEDRVSWYQRSEKKKGGIDPCGKGKKRRNPDLQPKKRPLFLKHWQRKAAKKRGDDKPSPFGRRNGKGGIGCGGTRGSRGEGGAVGFVVANGRDPPVLPSR